MSDKAAQQTITELGKRMSYVTLMMHEAIARSAGITGIDHKYINILIEGGSMTAGELAKIAGLTTGAVTNVIDRLEKQKLVKREFVKDDRRKVIIVPNKDRVDKLLGPSFKILREHVVALVSSRTASEQKIIESYLTDVIAAMEKITAEFSNNE